MNFLEKSYFKKIFSNKIIYNFLKAKNERIIIMVGSNNYWWFSGIFEDFLNCLLCLVQKAKDIYEFLDHLCYFNIWKKFINILNVYYYKFLNH